MKPQPDTSAWWIRYFQTNARSLMPIPWHLGVQLSDVEKSTVAASIQEFQVGESSEGRHLIACAVKYAHASGDHEYVRALKQFIGEEHRHARDLGRVLDLAEIERVGKSWPDSVFRWLRHRAGLELSIAVLLTAEMIANIYYAALQRATSSHVIEVLCEQILRDEAEHVRFQCERLAILRQHRRRWLIELGHALHRFFMFGTCCVVWLHHRRVLRAGGLGWWSFRHAARQEVGRAIRVMDPRTYAFAEPAPAAEPALRQG